MLSFFPRDVLDEIFNLIESVSEGFSNLLLKNQLKVREFEMLWQWLSSENILILITNHISLLSLSLEYYELVCQHASTIVYLMMRAV